MPPKAMVLPDKFHKGIRHGETPMVDANPCTTVHDLVERAPVK